MNTKQQIGSLLWIILVLAALPSPLWLNSWTFLVGVALMAAVAELHRKVEATAHVPGAKASGLRDWANVIPILAIMLVVTSPFWVDWGFFVGGVSMAIASELRKEPPVIRKPMSLQGGPKLATRRSFKDAD